MLRSRWGAPGSRRGLADCVDPETSSVHLLLQLLMVNRLFGGWFCLGLAETPALLLTHPLIKLYCLIRACRPGYIFIIKIKMNRSQPSGARQAFTLDLRSHHGPTPDSFSTFQRLIGCSSQEPAENGDYIILDSVRSGDASGIPQSTAKAQSIHEVNSVEIPKSKDSTSRSPWAYSDYRRSCNRMVQIEESLDMEIRCLTGKIGQLKKECYQLEQSNQQLLKQRADLEVRQYQKKRTRSQKNKSSHHRKTENEVKKLKDVLSRLQKSIALIQVKQAKQPTIR